jgi:hypothetical protein
MSNIMKMIMFCEFNRKSEGNSCGLFKGIILILTWPDSRKTMKTLSGQWDILVNIQTRHLMKPRHR